jgi:ABC-type antimicrobial peptide transport system permease subunit
VLGIITGHLIGAGGSVFLRRMVGEGIDWLVTSPAEWIYLGVVVVLAILAGLVPALKAYRTPVATNLVAA